MSVYKVAYIQIYQFVLKTPSADYNPEQVASIILAILVSLSFAVFFLILISLNLESGELFFDSNTPILTTFIASGVINYLLFIKNKSYLQILKEYLQQDRSKRKKHSLLVIIYFAVIGIVFMSLV